MKEAVKKSFCILIIFMFLISTMAISALADNKIKVKLNDVQLNFDVTPQMINNVTMVPMRQIFEALGAKLEWDNASQTITATKGSTKMILSINKKDMIVNSKTVTLELAPEISCGRTLLPLRAVAEGFGAIVSWDSKTETASITSKIESTVSTSQDTSASASNDESNSADSGISYYFTESTNGLPRTISSSNKDWQINIPFSYNTVMAQDGSYIFQNSVSSDTVYIEIRDLKGVNKSLNDIAKDALKKQMISSYNGGNNAIKQNITRKNIYNVNYYTFKILTNNERYCYMYFTIYNNKLFQFVLNTSSDDVTKDFQSILNSFVPTSCS